VVDFDDLMSRLRRFKEEERVALERWSQNCCRLAMEPTAVGDEGRN